MLLGGNNGGNLSDTWAWNGTTWTQRFPAVSPIARQGHALTFDGARGETVLFAGFGGSVLLNDTWAWDGTTWTQRSPAAAPLPRYYHALAYDDAHGETVLFGGLDITNATFNDTWVWNGSNWAQRSPLASPTPRIYDALAFDGARNEIVMFGGLSTSGVTLNDTWLHATLGGTCAVADTCIDGSYCVDGVCCSTESCGACKTCAGTSPGRCTPVLNTEDTDTCAASNGKSCSNLGECKAALGAVARAPADCASGFLVDGVCCASAACPACQTCDIAKTENGVNPGRCDYVRAGLDPKDNCNDDGALTCKQDGACDGRGACRQYAKGAACGNNVCLRNAATGQFCTGAGECAAARDAIECGSFTCRDGQCPTACLENSDCAPLHHCEAGACAADRGAACDGDHTVTSPTGESLDCKLYKCEGATCKSSCTSKTDCVGAADCAADHTCVAFQSLAPTPGGGCSCGIGVRDPARSPLELGWLLGAVYVFRRRSRARDRRGAEALTPSRSLATRRGTRRSALG